MKLWIRTLFKDLLAIALLLTVFYFAGREYYRLVSSKIRGTGDPIGMVSDMAYYPKRQLEGDEYTSNLSLEDDLYEGDYISSDSFSSILMNLVDGTEISLEQGSRIILRLSEDTILFDGTISALSTKEREIPLQLINMNEDDPKPIILSDSSEITIMTDEKGNLNMAVLTGEVTRGTDTISENEQFSLTPEGEASVNKLLFVLASPPNNSSWVTFEETQNIRFAWDEPDPDDTRSLWIALDTSFERIVYRKDDLTRLSFELDLLPGDYFWRVGDEESETYSSTGKFKIIENMPLKALLPSSEAEFTYRDQPPKQTFMWQGAESADFWDLEIAGTEDMAQTILTERSRYNQIQLDDLEEGDYWWRVTAQYRDMENISTVSSGQPKQLRVIRQTKLLPPSLISPEADTEVTPLDFSEGIRFSWKGDGEIDVHRFILSENPDMSDPIFREDSRRNYVTASEDLPPGAYYWQVIPQTGGSPSGESSEIRSLICRERQRNLELIYPSPEQAIELTQGNSIVFRWDSYDNGGYRFRLWRKSENTEKLVANRLVDREETSQYIAEGGDYLWQVDMIDGDNRVILEGNRQPFAVDQPLLPPQLISPQPGSTLSLIGEDSLDLSWTNVSSGDAYSGRLVREDDGEEILSFTGSGERAARVDISLLDETNYIMELQSEREDEGKGFPTVSDVSRSYFTIGEIVNFEAPRIFTPADGTVTNRLDLLKDGLDIRWDSSYPFPTYEVLLKQKESGTLLMRRVTNSRSYEITDIYPDDYLIEVTGIDQRGGMSPSGVASLTVLAVEPLGPVSLLTPRNGQIVDMSELDSLEFRWDQVEGEEQYNIALYDFRGNALVSLDNYRENRYVFTDLSKLDVGEFIFTVEAVKEYNDIGIVRMSPETRISFTITINTIGEAPVILSPDIQYAD